jgi:hypothetical protein
MKEYSFQATLNGTDVSLNFIRIFFFFYGASAHFLAMVSPTFFLIQGLVEVSSLTGWGCQPQAQPPTWRTRVSVFVRVITFDLCDTGPNWSRIYVSSQTMAVSSLAFLVK